MENHEIVRIDLQPQEPEGPLSQWLDKLRQTISGVGAALEKSLGRSVSRLNTALSGSAGLLQKVFQNINQGSKSATASLSRTVLGFDQLNRLSKKSGGKAGDSLLSITPETVEKGKALVSRFRETVINPLSQLWNGGLKEGMQNLGSKILELMSTTDQGTTATDAYAQSWGKVTGNSAFWNKLLAETQQLTGPFWEQMRRSGLVADQTAGSIQGLTGSTQQSATAFTGLGTAAGQSMVSLKTAWSGTDGWFQTAVTGPVAQSFTELFSRMDKTAQESSRYSKGLFTDMGGHFSREFSGAWQSVSAAFGQGGQVFDQVESGVLTGLKSAVNGLITGVNRVSVEPFRGLNTVLDKLQSIRIGSLQPFSFLSWRASVPKIPYLAQGAVLPANKPFLAMVGDQRHGTNVEAPLSTIQEALQLTLNDYTQSNLAGHAQTAQLLSQLLTAVRGIRVGDECIANACDRHHEKMAIMNGV